MILRDIENLHLSLLSVTPTDWILPRTAINAGLDPCQILIFYVSDIQLLLDPWLLSFWKCSGALLIPKGILLKQYRPYSVNVVSSFESAVNI